MAITLRLDLRQGQSLVMTPQLQQSIKLVQLNNIELSAFIDTELEKNLLLERKDGDTSESEAQEGAGAGGELIESDSELERTADMSTGKELADIDLSPDSYWSREGKAAGGGTSDSLGPMPSLPGRGVDPDSGMDRIEQTASAPERLREHLLIQLGMEISEASDRLIGSALIDMVDGGGYLSGDLKGVAESFSCPLARIENVLEKLQDFDPPGVGARDLGECLAN